ncbi:MAG: peptidoglycan DD-metalloendopeptidase family protein [Gemmatimonadota bacterium]
MKYLPATVLFLSLLIAAGACTRYVPTAMKSSGPRAATSRDRYEDELLRSEAGSGRAYAEWSAAGRRALRERLSIRPSFRELLHFSPERATAVGYRLQLKRGQRVSIALERRGASSLFTEVFEEIGPGEPIFRLVHSASARAVHVTFEARTDGPHVVRVQPELFGSGEVMVAVTTAAGHTFPVLGKNSRAIGSFFGDARDGGRRDHEGIDIFAAAGTSVVAVAPGVISAVNHTPIGGKVIWQHDPQRNVTYYYAHLRTQNVRAGARVQAGDVIGTVGNTGNARTTPPHLHFSVYKPGRAAIDPVPFLYDQPGDVARPLLVDLGALGDMRTTTASRVTLRREPSAAAAAVATLSGRQDVYVVGGVHNWYRVQLEDGRGGFLRARDLGVIYSTKSAH